jgi:hypothetical protein
MHQHDEAPAPALLPASIRRTSAAMPVGDDEVPYNPLRP